MQNVWIVLLAIKLLLFGGMGYYVYNTRQAIDMGDAVGVKENFDMVENLSYVTAFFLYVLFLSKFIKGDFNVFGYNIGEYSCPNHYSIVCAVNISMIMVLLMFVLQMKKSVMMIQGRYLSDKFKYMEVLVYIMLVFNIVTDGVFWGFNKDDTSHRRTHHRSTTRSASKK